MKKYLYTLVVLFVLCFTHSSCRRDTFISNELGYTTFQTVALGSDLNGTMRVRAFGSGATKSTSIESAKRNAVRDVIFKGVTTGSPEHQTRPLITEVNAQERYESYFYEFFADNGPYTQFCSLADETLTSRVKAKNKTQTGYGVVVTVNRAALKQKLINDGIIKY